MGQRNQHESKNTNIAKRLYWMKRPFGCEIRQPVTQLEIDELLDSSECDDDSEVFEPLAKKSKVKNVVKNWKMNKSEFGSGFSNGNFQNYGSNFSSKYGNYSSGNDLSTGTPINMSSTLIY